MEELIYLRGGKVFDKTYTVIGCGGVGSWVAVLLALLGARKLYLVDDDIVELHNLNRTPYRLKDVGKFKSIALSEIISEIRNIPVIPIVARYSPDIDEFQDTYICHCTDTYTQTSSLFPLSVGYDDFNISMVGQDYLNTILGDEATTYTSSNALSAIISAILTLLGSIYDTYNVKPVTIKLGDIINKLKG